MGTDDEGFVENHVVNLGSNGGGNVLYRQNSELIGGSVAANYGRQNSTEFVSPVNGGDSGELLGGDGGGNVEGGGMMTPGGDGSLSPAVVTGRELVPLTQAPQPKLLADEKK